MWGEGIIAAHKYIKREWKNGKWNYFYPVKVVKKLTDKKKESKSSDKLNSESSDKENKDSTKKFKYIKREWKNGKWYYTYPEDLKNKVNNLLDKAKDALGFDEKEACENAKKEADTARARMNINYSRASIDAPKTEAQRDLPGSIRKARDAGLKFVEARKEFMNTPLGKLQAVKDRGSFGVKNLFINKTHTKMTDRDRANHTIDVTIDKTRREMDNTPSKTNETYEFLNQLKKLRSINSLPMLPIKRSPTSLAKDEAAINPNYSRENPNTSMNCFLCTVAYDLRRRGYDVKAREQKSMYNIKKATRLYKGTETEHFIIDTPFEKRKNKVSTEQAWASLNESLLSYGNGARGNLCVYWKIGGGHSISWEVENNKVVIRDTQRNTVDNLLEWRDIYLTREIYSFRTDNWEPSKATLKLVESTRK